MKAIAPRLRHRVTLQRQVLAQDMTTGDVAITWTTVHDDLPAEVLTGPGREFIGAQTKQAQTTARINIRWFPGVDQTYRILWDGRVYNIVSIETDVTGRRELRLRCEDGVNDGR